MERLTSLHQSMKESAEIQKQCNGWKNGVIANCMSLSELKLYGDAQIYSGIFTYTAGPAFGSNQTRP
jgi:hypothetical protein